MKHTWSRFVVTPLLALLFSCATSAPEATPPPVDTSECDLYVEGLTTTLSSAEEGLAAALTEDAEGLVPRFRSLTSRHALTNGELCQRLAAQAISTDDYERQRACGARLTKRLQAMKRTVAQASKLSDARRAAWMVEAKILSVEDALLCEGARHLSLGELSVKLPADDVEAPAGVHLKPTPPRVAVSSLPEPEPEAPSPERTRTSGRKKKKKSVAPAPAPVGAGASPDVLAEAPPEDADEGVEREQGAATRGAGDVPELWAPSPELEAAFQGGGAFPTVRVEASLMCRREEAGGFVEVPGCDGARLKEGDQFRLRFQVNAPALVYVMMFNGAGQFQLLFPVAEPSHVVPGGLVQLPGEDAWWTLEGASGLTHIQLVAALGPVSELEALRAASLPAGGEARAVVAQRARGRLEEAVARRVELEGEAAVLLPSGEVVLTDALFGEGAGVAAVEFAVELSP